MTTRTLARRVGGALGLTVLWFVAVDWSWFVEKCDHCTHDRDILQYRVFTLSIAERIEDSTGVPDPNCRHSGMTRWHKHRRWGLLFCAWPCWNGTLRLSETGSPCECLASGDSPLR